MILGLDPGYEESALVLWDGERVCDHMLGPNEDLLMQFYGYGKSYGVHLVIEKIESFGMAVGKTVFETVYWSGRFAEAFSRTGGSVHRISRREVKIHLCGQARATDSNIRQALIDRFGPSTKEAFGTKKAQGPLYGITSHKLSALAVALTYWDTHRAAAEGREIRPNVTADF